MPHVVTTWFGAFLCEGDRVVAAYPVPVEPQAVSERLELRRSGRLTPEEARLLGEHPSATLSTRDRRLLPLGVRFALEEEPRIEPEAYGISSAMLRPLLLEAASVDLQRGWDPSVHVMETVRAAEELEDMTNRIAERLESWAERPEPEAPAEGSGAAPVPSSPAPVESRPPDPELLQGRAGLTQL
ncbi:MAG: hypothetical protein L3K11_08850, partial [Thermoplasmata archaeon]|nr:hypothetical protein [Thermoplasmata archaeon]